MRTNLFIQKEITNQLPWPYSQCKLEEFESFKYEKFKSYLLSMNLEYDLHSCYEFCFRSIFKDCLEQKFPLAEEIEDCNDFASKKFTDFCMPSCPDKCYITHFNKEMSYLTFPTRAYFKNNKYSQLNFSKDYNTLKQSVLRLGINYSIRTKITNYTRKCSIDDLISKIGGILGCFLGASLISLVEIFELLLEMVLKLISPKKQVQNKNPINK